MPTLTVFVLGSFRAMLGAVAVNEVAYQKVQALLAYLVMAPNSVYRRETLAGIFWPETSERRARHSLSQALSELRRILQDRDAAVPYLLVGHETIQFTGASDYWVDGVAFADLIRACEAHAHSHIALCDPCGERLKEATALYRGGFLDGFSLADSSAFEEWTMVQRERIQRMALNALHHLTLWHERRGQVQEALACARRQLELDPWRDSAHRQVMRLLAQSGQRTAALAQYVICRRILAEELGSEPEAVTTALYEQIRDGGPLGGTSLAPNNLPASLTPLVGRRRELGELAQLLRDPTCRLLTLVGPGGMGKSRLALELARQQLASFPDGVFLVSLAPVTTLEAVVPTVAKALGVPLLGGGSPEQGLIDYLRAKHLLLILDNCEHLVDAAGWIVSALQAAPSLKVMATSRVRFRVKGEQVVPIEGMTWSADADHPNSSDAVQLFLQGAQRAQLGFRPTPDDLRHIARICRLVRGVPLGILLAAAWSGVLKPDEIAASIERSLDFLRVDWQDLPQEQRSLRAVFERSWALLNPREQEVFQGLSVFRGTFTREVAQVVLGVTIHELMTLMEKSLLYRTSEGRFELHELVRQYAEERLAGSQDGGRAVRDRHSGTYCRALEAWAGQLKGSEQLDALTTLDAEIGDAQASWEWAVAHHQVRSLAQAMEGLCLFYEFRSRYQEGISTCAMAVDRLAELRAEPPCPSPQYDALRLRAQALAWRARFHWLLRQPEEARRFLAEGQAALELLQLADADVRAERAFVYMEQGHQVVHADPQVARAHYMESLALYRELTDRWSIANALDALGYLAVNQGDYDEVRRRCEESLAIRTALGDQHGMSVALISLSAALVYQGQFAEGERLARARITIHRELDQPAGVADGLRHMAATLFIMGRFEESREALEECLPILRRLGTRHYDVSFAHSILGHTRTHLAEYDRAYAPLEQGLALAREIHYQRGIGMALLGMAMLALFEGQFGRARSLFEEALAILRGIDQRDEFAGTLGMLALTDLISVEAVSTAAHLAEAYRVVAETRGLYPLFMSILPATALMMARQGELARALELYALASRYPFAANSRWLADVVGSRIAAAAEALSPEEVAAAQAQGRGADLWATVTALAHELDTAARR